MINPFKPHVIQSGDHFAIRKLTLTGWRYLDKLSRHWWTFNFSDTKFYSKSTAHLRLIFYHL